MLGYACRRKPARLVSYKPLLLLLRNWSWTMSTFLSPLYSAAPVTMLLSVPSLCVVLELAAELQLPSLSLTMLPKHLPPMWTRMWKRSHS